MNGISSSKKIERSVDKYKLEAMQDEEFMSLTKKLKISEDEIRRNTSKLYDTLEELDNCKHCSNLYNCKNKVKGYVIFPETKMSKLYFSYIPCKYKKQALKSEEERVNSNNIVGSASMKDIKITKNRTEVIKWIKDFYKSFNPYKFSKGLYLHGNFGTGKTFIIAALINELKNKYHLRTEIIYFPELLRNLKENLSLVNEKIYYLENVDILLIDDIGAEKVTEWGRDEILGTILQTRMNKGMITFFTSNLTIDELTKHLSLVKDSEDLLKAKRIIERIKYLAEDKEMLGTNYRDKAN